MSAFHSSLFSAFIFICIYLSFGSLLMSLSSIIRFLPRGLLPSILPSITSLRRLSCHGTWPNHFIFLLLMAFINLLSSPTLLKTSSFDILSIQQTFSILLQIHISQFSNHFISTFLKAQKLNLCLMQALPECPSYTRPTLPGQVLVLRVFRTN